MNDVILPSDTLTVNQMALAMMVGHVLEYAKKAQWFPWLTADSERLNRVVALVMAIATSAGVTIVTTGSLQAGGSLTIAFPSAQLLIAGVLRAALQFGMQQFYYKQVIKQ